MEGPRSEPGERERIEAAKRGAARGAALAESEGGAVDAGRREAAVRGAMDAVRAVSNAPLAGVEAAAEGAVRGVLGGETNADPAAVRAAVRGAAAGAVEATVATPDADRETVAAAARGAAAGALAGLREGE